VGYTLFHGDVGGSDVDLLSFDDPLDHDERGIIKRYDHSHAGLERLINHRTAVYSLLLQNTARYLVQHYEDLSERTFKGRNIRTFGRQWYEYIWPRTPQLMLSRNKIVTPRLVRTAEFAWDSAGYLPQDSLITLGTPETGDRKKTYEDFKAQLVEAVGTAVTPMDIRKYCLGFLNSDVGVFVITAGRTKTPKGSYTVNEEVLDQVPIPVPKNKAVFRSVLDAVDALVAGTSDSSDNEARINDCVFESLGLTKTQEATVRDWATRLGAEVQTRGPVADDELAELTLGEEEEATEVP
jgi:hypothetical protein